MKKFIQVNLWIDNNINKFQLFIFISILISIVSIMGLSTINTLFLFLGVSLLLLVSIMSLVRKRWVDMDDSKVFKYFEELDLPEINDIIIVTNAEKLSNYFEMGTPFIYAVCNNGTEFKVSEIKFLNGNRIIRIGFNYENKLGAKCFSFLDYEHTKKWWTTKSDIRNKKLEEIGI